MRLHVAALPSWFPTPGPRFTAFDAFALRGLFVFAVWSSASWKIDAPELSGLSLWIFAVIAWLARSRRRRIEVVLPALSVAWWMHVIVPTGLGSSPWILGILLEIGVAALRLSAPGCVVATVAGSCGLAFVAILDPTPSGSTRALVALACVLWFGLTYLFLLRGPRRDDSEGTRMHTARLAHGLKNRLHAVSGFAELLATDLEPDDPRHGFAQSIRRGLSEANESLADLMAPGRQAGTRMSSTIDLHAIVEQALETCRGLLESRHVRVENQVQRGVAADLDAGTLDAVLVELIQNAIQAMPTRGGSLVLIGSSDPPRLTIRDSGPGIPALLRERVFEPRFSTRAGGHGLGLSDVRQLLHAAGGSIRIGAAPYGGGEIHIDLPASQGGRETHSTGR